MAGSAAEQGRMPGAQLKRPGDADTSRGRAKETEPLTDEHPSGERRPIPKRLRYEVLRRDNHTCRYCVYPNKTWRYFCGCCWNRIRERQSIARSLIEAEDGE